MSYESKTIRGPQMTPTDAELEKSTDEKIAAQWLGWRIGPTKQREIAEAIRSARYEERERCARIVDRHPDEAHPSVFDPEEVRGCCEEMAARIRSGEK